MKSLPIIFENSEILLVNKEAGISVQGGAGVSHPLDEELSRQVGQKVHLVHRLDKDTAGLLIVAKNSAAAAKWIRLVSGHDVSKEYTAICIGIPNQDGRESKEGTLESMVEAHGRQQKALSHYRLEQTGIVPPPDGTSAQEGIPLSLLSIRIETGRMHQIRIQTAQAGFPVAGDDQHGDFKKNKQLRKAGIKKLMLASTRLTIPVDGAMRTFGIPLPPHMQAVADKFF